jgi:membrane fusion protein (multidrug efflux system)
VEDGRDHPDSGICAGDPPPQPRGADVVRQRDAGGGSEVFVVKDDGRVASQTIRTGAVQDGLWLVSEGLKEGDRVVVDGFQKFAPGDKVKPQPWGADAAVGSLPDPRSAKQADAR